MLALGDEGLVRQKVAFATNLRALYWRLINQEVTSRLSTEIVRPLPQFFAPL